MSEYNSKTVQVTYCFIFPRENKNKIQERRMTREPWASCGKDIL